MQPSPPEHEPLAAGIESWRFVWRKGFAPQLSTRALQVLLTALEVDDIRLTQGSTTTPPGLMCVGDWPVEACCVLAFCGWQGEGIQTISKVEDFFARMCYEADELLGDRGGCRWFLNWYDDTPRSQMRSKLAEEVRLALALRS
jgi:hypothetical protein